MLRLHRLLSSLEQREAAKRHMSGSIPPQLTADDARRVADVRRDVWTAGLRGAVAGVFIGSTGWLGARHLNLLPKAFRTPNHFSLATMGCGALVSFLSSLAAGKNSVQRIGDVFSRGKGSSKSRYRSSHM